VEVFALTGAEPVAGSPVDAPTRAGTG
jgi:hypothetical protein